MQNASSMLDNLYYMNSDGVIMIKQKKIEETMEEYCNKMIMVDNIIILFLK